MSQQINLFGAPVVRYYRTQVAVMFCSEEPRVKTPDPIGSFRVTVVSDIRGKYNPVDLRKVVRYTMFVMTPWVNWKEAIESRLVSEIYVAEEIDEPIDVDELENSVPVYKKLHYAERVVTFFSSRRDKSQWFRVEMADYIKKKKLPDSRTGDYVYDEGQIKNIENERFMSRRVRTRFNNEKGVLE